MSDSSPARQRRLLVLVRAAISRSQPLVAWLLAWVLEHFPIIGRKATRMRRAVYLEPYVHTATLRGSLTKLALIGALPFFFLIYGFYFALTVPFLIVPFLAPIGIIGLLIIWCLPDTRRPPTFGLELLLPAFITVMVIWPDYLAIALPGLPWITLRRLAGFPMAALLLVCLSVSARFRKEVADSLSAIKPLTYFYFGFVLDMIFTSILSATPAASAQLVFTYQINWTTIFIISCVLFRSIAYVERYFALICWLAAFTCGLTILETYREHLPWAAHIPGFLKVPDELMELVLKPNFRLFLNRYRAKATFFTPLALGEFLSMTTPFFLHFGLSRINPILRICCWAMIPIIFTAIRFTDSRLGLVGMLACVVLYGFLWSVVNWRRHRSNIIAAAMIYGYPAVAALFMGLIMASGKARVMLLGGNAQASSNDQRDAQLELAMKALAHRPIGFGAGRSGESLNLPPGSFITVDNYFVTVAMDFGFLGAFLWYGIFVIAIYYAVKSCLDLRTADRPEARLLAPLAVTLASLLVVKWVHGQDSNHPIFFMMVGMISALVWRLRNPDRLASIPGGARLKEPGRNLGPARAPAQAGRIPNARPGTW